MTICADTSFIVKLLAPEQGADAAIDLFRRLHRPRLPYTQIHRLEVESAIAQKAFFAQQAGQRKKAILREKDAALNRLEKWLQVALLVETEIEWETCFGQAIKKLPDHSEKLGCRTMDIVHIAIATELQAEIFITCDERQAKAAKAEGLRTELVRSA
jgi:predicted nucleic acid-binding protein